jgi:hypothetical protein
VGQDQFSWGRGPGRGRAFSLISFSSKGVGQKGVEKVSVNGIDRKGKEKVSVNGIDIFLLEAQDAAWLASYEWNIRARFITS